LWSIISPVLAYSAQLTGEISDNIVGIDQAMKWGFGWDLGPFEIWDAIGVSKSVVRMESEGISVPSWVKDLLDNGNDSFYKQDN
ncbi:3-hydroxyacyl-CoA dehydrogenase family protein, partial [Pseudomonas sp. FW305-BF6]|uniref:3-hydroxyacyl-CoA dehydrogenase family protein n=1 Tax=Pseudomonas sp. FW305-BF6 TaxID=2070673 RepID=UPI001C4678C8